MIEEAKQYFETAVQAGARQRRGGRVRRLRAAPAGRRRAGSAAALRRALQLDEDHVEARIYLGNLLYDRGDFEARCTTSIARRPRTTGTSWASGACSSSRSRSTGSRTTTSSSKPWEARLAELAGEPDSHRRDARRDRECRRGGPDGQLELFVAEAVPPTERTDDPQVPPARMDSSRHSVVTAEGSTLDGTWDEIVSLLRDASGEFADRSVSDFMSASRGATTARRASASRPATPSRSSAPVPTRGCCASCGDGLVRAGVGAAGRSLALSAHV